jgi:hypothetical protein
VVSTCALPTMVRRVLMKSVIYYYFDSCLRNQYAG